MDQHQIDQLIEIADDLGRLIDSINLANYPLRTADLVHCPE